jgi:hypothetical protein
VTILVRVMSQTVPKSKRHFLQWRVIQTLLARVTWTLLNLRLLFTYLYLWWLRRYHVLILVSLITQHQVILRTRLTLSMLWEVAHIDHLVFIGWLSEVLELIIDNYVLLVFMLPTHSIWLTVWSLLVIVCVLYIL